MTGNVSRINKLAGRDSRRLTEGGPMSKSIEYAIVQTVLLMAFGAGPAAFAKTSHDRLPACVSSLSQQVTRSSTLPIHEIILGQRYRFGEYLHRYVVAGHTEDSGRTFYALIPMGRDPTSDTTQPRTVFAEQMAFLQLSADESAKLVRDSRAIGTVDVTAVEIAEPPHEELTADNTPLGTVIRVGPTNYVLARKDLIRTTERPSITSERLGLLPLREDFTPASTDLVFLRLSGMSDYYMNGRIFRDLQRLGHGTLRLATTIENGNETITVASFNFTGRISTPHAGVALQLRDLKFK